MLNIRCRYKEVTEHWKTLQLVMSSLQEILLSRLDTSLELMLLFNEEVLVVCVTQEVGTATHSGPFWL